MHNVEVDDTLTDIELTSTLTNIEDWLRATVPRRNGRLQFPYSDIAPSSPLMVGAEVISHQMLMTNDGAGKSHEGADRAPDARDRGEECSVQAICLRYRLLNRQGAGATGKDRQFDDADGCSLWRSFSPRVIWNSHQS